MKKLLLKVWRTITRIFLGYDVFISYARADATVYAQKLGEELSKKSISVFLDQAAAPPDPKLPISIIKSLNKSSVMLIISSKEALNSKGVYIEVKSFIHTRRVVIPVDISGEIDKAIWYSMISGAATVKESNNALQQGTPSSLVLKRIDSAIGFKRRSRRLAQIFWSIVTIIIILISSSSYILYQLKEEGKISQLKNQAFRLVNEAEKLKSEDVTKSIKTVNDAYQLNKSKPFLVAKRSLINLFYEFIQNGKAFYKDLAGPYDSIHTSAFSSLGKWIFLNYGENPNEYYSELLYRSPINKIHKYSIKHKFVRDAIFDTKDNYLITCGENLKILNLHTQKSQNISNNDCWSIAISTDGKFLAEGHAKGLTLYSMKNFDVLWKKVSKKTVDNITFFSNNTYIASNINSTVNIHTTLLGNLILKDKYEPYILTLKGSSNAPLLFIGGEHLDIFKFNNNKLIHIKQIKGDDTDTNVITISKKSNKFSFGGNNGLVQIWHITKTKDEYNISKIGTTDIHKDERMTHYLSTYNHDSIRTIKLLDNSNHFITTGARMIKLWTFARDKLLTFSGHTCNDLGYCGVQSITSNHDGSIIVTGGQDGLVKVWSSPNTSIDLIAHKEEVNSVAMNKHVIISGGGNMYKSKGEIFVWDRNNLSTPPKTIKGNFNEVVKVAINDKLIAISSADNTVRLWDINTLHLLGLPIKGKSIPIDIDLSINGKYLAIAWEKNIDIIDLKTRIILYQFKVDEFNSIENLTFSKNNDTIYWIESFFDETLICKATLYNNKQTIIAKLDIPLYSIDISPDDLSLIVASDKIAYLLDVASSEIITKFQGHSKKINQVKFSDDGRFVYTASKDGTIRQWLTPKGINSWLTNSK